MDLLAKYQFFKERSVVKMFSLKGGRLPTINAENLVFITRPDLDKMDKIAENVKVEEASGGGSGSRLDFHILFVPNKSMLCEKRLKERGVYGSFAYLDELSIFWYPLDTDLVSMERPSIFSDFHLGQDPTSLHEMAKAMIALQAVYGFVPKVFGKGQAAQKLFEFMVKMRKERAGEEPDVSPQIDRMIILDRQVDLISPLITQLTYEGLIDELFQIKNSSVKLPAEKFSSQDEQASLSDPISTSGGAGSHVKQFVLNSNDELFADLRDKNFNAVGPTLSKKARAISAQFEERHGAKTVKEFKSFVDKLPQMQTLKQSLATHTSIAELIKEETDSSMFLEYLQVEQELVNNQNSHKFIDFLEDSACQDVDHVRWLRVACLQSIIGNGLKPKLLDSYRRLFLQAYGHPHLASLISLEKAGLLTAQNNSNASASNNYAVLRKRLNLTQDDVNELDPTDVTYVHSVYAPLSVRLVQNCARPGWRAIRDILDLLPGPSFEDIQKTGKAGSSGDGITRTLVVFVGGCTYAEVSALRFLSQLEDTNVEYLVATTSVINGKSLIESVLTPLSDPTAF